MSAQSNGITQSASPPGIPDSRGRRREVIAGEGRLRPAIRRAIQEHLPDPLATKLLAGEFKAGVRIKITSSDEGLLFKTK